MSDKKPTRYQRLKDGVREFAHKVANPKRVGMWSYPRARLADSWKLDDLYERVKAGDQLGYDVVLFAEDIGLVVRYIAKRPSLPFEFQY